MFRFMKGTKKRQRRKLPVLLLLIILLIFQSSLSAFAVELDSAEYADMQYSPQEEAEYSAESETIAVQDTGSEMEDGTEEGNDGETEKAAESTEKSFYERLMTCGTLSDIPGLLESEGEPDSLLTETERNDFADYVYDKLEHSDWPDENAESNVDSIMRIFFGNDNYNTEII